MTAAGACVLGVRQSFSARAWHWRAADHPVAIGLAQRLGVPEIVGRILAGRGVGFEEAARVLDPTLRDWLPDPSLFLDMDAAVERLHAALRDREPIVIFGDYDVDGATSAALLIRFLRQVGAVVSHYIPDRLLEGYGPSAAALLALRKAGAGLVVTVDCGTQSFEALAAAQAAGLDVIVVDHHKASVERPEAVALVNPNRFDDVMTHSHGHLAAVGLAFLLVVALNRRLRDSGWYGGAAAPDLLALLDLVALGTVCDVMPLTGLNRAYVRQGLKILAARQHVGLKALADVSGMDSEPGTFALGFQLGPRINAGGRVGQADLGVRLLTTDDAAEAQALAAELDRLNAERRAIEALVLEEALGLADASTDPVLMVTGQGWHPGIIGIVAGRLKERFNRPAIVIGIEDGVGKGSGRSVPGVDLGAAVLAAREVGLLAAGGGHAMAAGLTVAEDRIADLARFLNERLAEAVAGADAHRQLKLDGVASLGGLNAALVDAMDHAGPYGAGWPGPVLAAADVRPVKVDVVGQDHIRLILTDAAGGRLKAMAFRAAETPLGAALLASRGQALHVAGRLKRDDWAGGDATELHIEDAAAA